MLEEGSACGSTSKYTVHSAPMMILKGLSCYFATDGYGNAFKNPHDAARKSNFICSNSCDQKKGVINIRMATAGDDLNGTSINASSNIAAGSSSGFFIVEYYTAQTATGTEGEYKGKIFELK